MSEADQVRILKAEHAELENALEQEKHKQLDRFVLRSTP